MGHDGHGPGAPLPAWLVRARDPSAPPLLMGVLNITPDSFSDGGLLHDGRGPALDAVRRRAEALVAAGAELLDVGGESTRPGAAPVSVAEEADRVLPVLEALRGLAPLSVDTSSPALFAAAAAAGADLLNDVRALRRDGAVEAAAATGLPVCLMHMQGEPGTMQDDPRYADVVAEVRAWLAARVAVAEAAGIPRQRLLVDPGIGFGKTLEHNLRLLRHTDVLAELAPVLVGLSRKRMVGDLTGRAVAQRTAGSVGGALAAAAAGARLLRVHDVGETRDALSVWWAVHGA